MFDKEKYIERAKAVDALAESKKHKRKTLTKELKDELEVQSMLNYKEPEPEIISEPVEKEWDVPLGEEIHYFDPELSYEITGYRPITKDKGLDFDPKLFTVAADTYRELGRYTSLMPGTFLHRNHWVEEFNKCHDGVTIGRYRLTGENYFWLNYYRLLSVVSNVKGGEVRKEDFPIFINKQYEYFHYLEMVRKLGKDGLAFKSRGVGASEIAASNCAWAYTFIKDSMNIITAVSDDFRDDTLSKVWLELDFLNTCTEGAFRRVRMKVDTQVDKRASIVDKDGNESGWGAEIKGITSDKPGKLRGKRCYNVFFEEAGNFVNLIDIYLEGRALVELLGVRVGSRYIFGCVCAGTKVWTREGELKKIEDLKYLDGILGFKDNRSNIEPIYHLNPPQEKPCVRITLKNGETLECSEDHPILMRIKHVPRNKLNREKRDVYFTWEFVQAKDIMKHAGYKIIGLCERIDLFGTDTLFDPYLTGLLIGDGTYGFNSTPVLSNCDPEVLNYVKNKYSCRVACSHITADGKLYEELSIKGICPYLRWIGIYGQTKTKKRLPLFYQTLRKEDARLLLAGLFDTDGYIDAKTHVITLTQSTREILEQVQTLLYKFGIYSTIYKVNPVIRPGRKDKNPWFVLHIGDRKSLLNFKNEIPLKIKYKQIAASKAIDRTDGHVTTPGIREVAVASVESIGMQPVYNLMAGDSHTYLANNIITHNTSSGNTNPKLAGLKNMFYNPETYFILPYKHNYTRTKEVIYSGYFIPSYTMWFGSLDNPGFDNRGVVDEERAKAYYEDTWKKTTDPLALIKDKAEYCFTPEDAFIMEGSNAFNMEKLAEQLMNIDNKLVELPKQVRLKWPLDDEGRVNRKAIPTAEYGTGGLIRIIEPPILDNDGLPYSNLYTIGCLTPGEKVLTTNGLKNCEDITLDDTLFSITGKPVAIKNIQQYYKEDEDIYTFKLNNIFRTTTFTKEHPIYCCTEHLYRTPNWIKGSGIPCMSYSYDFKFKKASEVKVGDFVKVPNIYLEEKPIPFEKWDDIKVRIDRKIDNPLANPDFWWLIGLILGDGWACKDNHKVSIVFNKSEQFYINKCKIIVTELLHRTFTVQKDKSNVSEYSINLSQLNQFITENFGRGALNKHLSEWVKYLPKELKINLILGYLASDGCICPSKDSMCFVSCSYQLLEDFQDIFFSLGIINTVHWLRSSKKYYSIGKNTKISHVHLAWNLDVHGEMINKFKRMCSCPDLKLDKWQYKEFTNHAIHRCFFEDESLKYIYIKIHGITQSRYTGVVYNYHCDTSTFMCKYIPTHNCDSIDTSADTTTGQTDLSQFCVIVYRRQFGLRDPKIVAIYKYRPKQVSDAYDEAIKLCEYYNCKALVEATRVGVIEYFKKLGLTSYLMHKPKAVTSGKNTNQYGCPATVNIIEHNLQLINDYIENYYTQINYPEAIDEFTRYSYENKRKFDIVAAFGLALLADEDMSNKVPRVISKSVNLEITELGYFRNAYGLIEFGMKPKSTENYGDLMNYGIRT